MFSFLFHSTFAQMVTPEKGTPMTHGLTAFFLRSLPLIVLPPEQPPNKSKWNW